MQIQPGEIYMLLGVYKVEMRKSKHDGKWRLIGTIGEGFLCHKPCTVSGGGKSEISVLRGMILSGPVFVQDLKEDLTRLGPSLADRTAIVFVIPKNTSTAAAPFYPHCAQSAR